MRYLFLLLLLVAPANVHRDPPYNPFPDPSCGFGSAAPVKGVKFICGHELVQAIWPNDSLKKLHYGPVHGGKFCGFLFEGDRPGGKALIQLDTANAGRFDVVGYAEAYNPGAEVYQTVWLRWIDLRHSGSAAAARFVCEYGGYNGWHMHFFRKWS